MSEVHEQEAARAPRVGVHALATAAAGALPVPGLDRYLRALTRGGRRNMREARIMFD